MAWIFCVYLPFVFSARSWPKEPLLLLFVFNLFLVDRFICHVKVVYRIEHRVELMLIDFAKYLPVCVDIVGGC